MLKWIFLVQALLYLILMPLIRSTVEIGYYPPLNAGLLAVFSLGAGFLISHIYNGRVASDAPAASLQPKLRPRAYLVYAIPVLVILYAAIVLSFGLLNRRLGSEYMAELYASLPIYALAILRGYEILLVPLILMYAFGAADKNERRVVGFALLASLPFTGVLDSRSRLLLIVIYVICFIRPSVFVQFFYRNIRFYVAAVVVIGTFLFFSAQRSSSYTSFQEFLILEIYQRLDGLNLVTDLRDSGLINKLGQYDFSMFSPLVSKIPFLEAAQTAKLMGRTSTKQYYLQELLGRSQLDTANSMIADPLYFAGWLGVIIAFILIGYAIGRTDRFVAHGGLMHDTNKSVAAIAFVTAFAVFENDLVGATIVFVQNYILVMLLFALGSTRSIRVLQQGTLGVGSRRRVVSLES